MNSLHEFIMVNQQSKYHTRNEIERKLALSSVTQCYFEISVERISSDDVVE